MKTNIEVKFKGDLIVGGRVRTFTFEMEKVGGFVVYVWTNMPDDMKRVLTPNQYRIRSLRIPLTDSELLQCVSDIYEAYNEEISLIKDSCPHCGSYEGDATECPECGHGQ